MPDLSAQPLLILSSADPELDESVEPEHNVLRLLDALAAAAQHTVVEHAVARQCDDQGVVLFDGRVRRVSSLDVVGLEVVRTLHTCMPLMITVRVQTKASAQFA